MDYSDEIKQRLAEMRHKRDLTVLTLLGLLDSITDTIAQIGSEAKPPVVKVPSMYDVMTTAQRVLEHEDFENAFNVDPQESAFDVYTWTDFTAVAEGVPNDYSPNLVLTLEPIEGSARGALTMIELAKNGIRSSHVSAIGCEVSKESETLDNTGPGYVILARIYIRFKGGYLFRYFDIHVGIWINLLDLIRRAAAGDKTASIGSFVEKVIKSKHNAGVISAEKFVQVGSEGQWITALSDTQKVAQGVPLRVRDGSRPSDAPPDYLPIIGEPTPEQIEELRQVYDEEIKRKNQVVVGPYTEPFAPIDALNFVFGPENVLQIDETTQFPEAPPPTDPSPVLDTEPEKPVEAKPAHKAPPNPFNPSILKAHVQAEERATTPEVGQPEPAEVQTVENKEDIQVQQ
jgi:hypothetical protein